MANILKFYDNLGFTYGVCKICGVHYEHDETYCNCDDEKEVLNETNRNWNA